MLLKCKQLHSSLCHFHAIIMRTIYNFSEKGLANVEFCGYFCIAAVYIHHTVMNALKCRTLGVYLCKVCSLVSLALVHALCFLSCPCLCKVCSLVSDAFFYIVVFRHLNTHGIVTQVMLCFSPSSKHMFTHVHTRNTCSHMFTLETHVHTCSHSKHMFTHVHTRNTCSHMFTLETHVHTRTHTQQLLHRRHDCQG